jgi:pyruvate dehydrogenase E1 component beta subunit
MPGIKVVYPSNAYDAKGMMHTALRDDNFVVFLVHKGTAGVGWVGPTIKTTLSEVPLEDYTVPFGKAAVTREGTDITIVTLGMGVHQSLMAADTLKAEGISVEVLDLRSLVPLDRDTIIASVKKTGRLLVVDEDYLSFGVSGEILATVVEHDHTMLRSKPVRVCMPDIPIPFSRVLENHVLPLADRIADGVRTAIK